jgi:hypothetical protein
MAGALPSLHQMKPRTVYEKALQDFIEAAQQLARLNERFRQASFAEFEMLIGLGDEGIEAVWVAEADGRAGAQGSVSNRLAQ